MARSILIILLLMASMSITASHSVAGRSNTGGGIQKEDPVDLMATNTPVQDPTFVPSDRHTDVREIVPAALWPVYVMYTNFLNLVQLKYFTYINDTFDLMTFEDVKDSYSEGWEYWLLYYIGFAVCVTVGLIMTIGMCVGGIVFPCCRCCGKGGKQGDDEGAEHSSCCFRTCCCCCGCLNCVPARNRLTGRLILMVIVDAILVVGVLCMLYTNQLLNVQLQGHETVFDNIATGVQGIEPYLDSAVDDMNVSVLQRYSAASDKVFIDLYALPTEVGEELDDNTQVYTTIGILGTFSIHMDPNLINALKNVSANSVNLQEDASTLNTSVISVKENILAILSNECPGDLLCWEAGNLTNQLNVNVDYIDVDVTSAQTIIQEAIDDAFNTLVSYIAGNASEIIRATNASILAYIQDAESSSKQLESDMEDAILQLQDTLKGVNATEITETMSNIEATLDEYNVADIVYWMIVGMAQVLIIIVATNIVGLLYRWCPMPREGDSCLKCSRSQGSSWLLASAGFIFIGYWIFILVVMVTFAAGGLTYTELCRNVVYYNDNDEQVVLDVFDNLITNTLDINATVFGIFDTYVTCEANVSIYEALKMAENGFNISELLDITYVQEAIDELKTVDITIPSIDLYTDGLNETLFQLDKAAGLDYAGMKTVLNDQVTSVDMSELANLLTQTPHDGFLNESIALLRQLDANASAMTSLAQVTISHLNTIIDIFPVKSFISMGTILANTETFVNIDGSKFASGVINQTADALYTDITSLMIQIIYNVEYDIARCRPLYDSLTTLVDSVCVHALCPLNSFWFSLGWCVFFLLPLLTMSFTMVNVYRMKISREEASRIKKEKKEQKKLQKEQQKARNVEKQRQKQEIEQTKREEEERLRSQEQVGKYDEVKFDNLGFDPMEEYRKEVNVNNPSGAGTSQSPFAKDSMVILPMSTKGPSPEAGGGGLLDWDVPPPDYGDVIGDDGDLAQLY